MRIGFDATAAARQGGGIGRYVRELLRALAATDQQNTYRIFVASPRPLPHALPPLPARSSLFILPLHDRWLARAWHSARLPLPIELALGRLDLLHSPDFTLPPALPGTATVLTVHDLSFVRDPGTAAPALKQYLDAAVPRSVRRATHVLADSEATRNDLIDLYRTPPAKIEVLYSGVDARFRPAGDAGEHQAIRTRYGFGSKPFILSVGTLHPRKNYPRLIEAYARLPAPVRAEHNLVIAGGSDRSTQAVSDAIGRFGLEGQVLLPGFVADEDLPGLYRSAALFAYPSLYEGFGLPVLEAMACGLPAVTSTASCLPEVAGDAALLVDPYDVEALAEAIQQAASDNALRQRLIERGLARARPFTWQRTAEQVLKTYQRLAGSV